MALTRAYLKSAIRFIARKYIHANVSVHVDDTCMQSTGHSYDEVLDKLVPAVTTFADLVKKLKLKRACGIDEFLSELWRIMFEF